MKIAAGRGALGQVFRFRRRRNGVVPALATSRVGVVALGMIREGIPTQAKGRLEWGTRYYRFQLEVW
jgi:hypothetical protein